MFISFLCPHQISFLPNYSNFALAAIREAPKEATLSAEYVSCAEKQWRGKIISFIENWLGERCTQDRRSNTLLNAASYDLCSIILEIDYSSWECFWKYFFFGFLCSSIFCCCQKLYFIHCIFIYYQCVRKFSSVGIHQHLRTAFVISHGSNTV